MSLRTFPFSYLTSLYISLFLLVGIGCKTEPPVPELQVPDTYVFFRDGGVSVKFPDQTEQLNMLEELSDHMAETRRINGDIEGDRLTAMFRNGIGADFQQTYAKSLLSKTFPADVEMFQNWMDDMGTASQLQREAKEGQSGFLSETFGTGTIANSSHRGYLVNELGIEYQQIIEIGLMGAILYNQAMEVQLTKANMNNADNESKVDVFFYTEMEHAFDGAFGYFGLPLDYPQQGELARFWGGMLDTLNTGPGSGRFNFTGISERVMDAFLRGRTALTAQQYDIRDTDIRIIAETWATVIGGTAVDQLERSKSSYSSQPYLKHHDLSGAIACMMALKYHTGQNSFAAPLVDYAKIEDALEIVGLETNLWQVSDAELEQAIQLILSAFPNGVIQ